MNPIEMMNTIRDNASTEYRNLVPPADPNNVQAVLNPIINYQAVANEFVSTLVNRIVKTVITNRGIYKNPFADLKGDEMPLGYTAQEIGVNPAQARGYDPNVNPIERNLPDVKALYYNINRQDQYPVTINESMIAQAFTSWDGVNQFVSEIINSLYSGDRIDEQNLTLNMLKSAIGKGETASQQIANPLTDTDTAKKFATQIRVIAGKMRFASSNYNRYSSLDGATGNPFITWTDPENLIMFLSSEVAATLTTEVLAYAFNRDDVNPAAVIPKIYEVPDFGTDFPNVYGIICDRAFIRIFDNLQKMTEQYWGARMEWNYYWNHWQTMSCNPLANALVMYGEGTDLPTVSDTSTDDTETE